MNRWTDEDPLDAADFAINERRDEDAIRELREAQEPRARTVEDIDGAELTVSRLRHRPGLVRVVGSVYLLEPAQAEALARALLQHAAFARLEGEEE